MSAEKPEPGDVWVIFGKPCIIGQGSTIYREAEYSVNFGYLHDVDPKAEFTGINVFDLLSGDPSAWAAAMRFLPAPFLLEVGEGEEKREVIGLPKGFAVRYLMAESVDGRELDADGSLPPEWSVRVYPVGTDPDWKAHDAEAFPTAVTAALKGESDA